MSKRPRIADVKCSRIRFEPGDRVIVHVYCEIAADQEKKLRKGIQKWAGADVEVLIYNALKMDVTVEKRQSRIP